ncbi:MAG: DUF5610 domain-containing protein [Candidatus Latescibacteria bacterium]|nr:DUF5610 domain-containing protein [Candidatus Latescibacterota bacterium]
METAVHIERLTSHYRAQRTSTDNRRMVAAESGRADSAQRLEDRVEISAEMTVEVANGIVHDSVTEQINKALQEAGIDLKVEESGGQNFSPEGTARRIVGFATGFLDDFRQNHAGGDLSTQVRGFMSLTRAAIKEGFQNARSFLDDITKLSETIEQSIDRTFELTDQYLDDFAQEQVAETESETMAEV